VVPDHIFTGECYIHCGAGPGGRPSHLSTTAEVLLRAVRSEAVAGGGQGGAKKKRVHSAGYIDREVDLGPVRFALTDDQRSEISRFSGIPEDNTDAWAMIEVSIGLYRRRKVQWSHAMLPAEIRKELENLSQECANLQERLGRLIDRSLQIMRYRLPRSWPLCENSKRSLRLWREISRSAKQVQVLETLINWLPRSTVFDANVLAGKLLAHKSAPIAPEITSRRYLGSRTQRLDQAQSNAQWSERLLAVPNVH